MRLRPKYETDGAQLGKWLEEEMKRQATVRLSIDTTNMLQAAFWMPFEARQIFAGCPQVLTLDCVSRFVICPCHMLSSNIPIVVICK
jgi:hypothetical protein